MCIRDSFLIDLRNSTNLRMTSWSSAPVLIGFSSMVSSTSWMRTLILITDIYESLWLVIDWVLLKFIIDSSWITFKHSRYEREMKTIGCFEAWEFFELKKIAAIIIGRFGWYLFECSFSHTKRGFCNLNHDFEFDLIFVICLN